MRIAALSIIVLLAAAVTGYPRVQAAPSAGTITLYTSESEDDVNLLVQDFMHRTPGITVKIFRAGSGPVEAKIEAESQAGAIQADVIWFADITFFQNLARKDLLLPYRPPAAGRVSPEFHYDRDRYHEVRLIFNVVAFNTQQVKFRPTSWWDLTLPRYRGRVGMPSPFISGAAFAHVGTFAAMPEFGWGFYQKLAENHALVFRSNGDVIQKLASGEIAIGQVVDFFVRALRAQGSPVDYIVPKEGAVLVPTPVGIIKGTANRPTAEAFINYLYTPEAQRLFASRAYIPVVPGIAVPPGTPEAAQMKIIQPNLSYIDQHREEIKTRFTALFGTQ
ncbi:MAG TPA: ABC transporter substrate-binding protein [bacterium]|nr:ABC transporter substrate-binding protein [bacterium]